MTTRDAQTATLIEILTGPLVHSAYYAIYARRIDGEFRAESSACIGNCSLSNGGVYGDFVLFATNATTVDFFDICLGLRVYDGGMSEKMIRAAMSLIDLKNKLER
jgi:hypothetical protein